jgi:hypothetical protein
VIVELLDGPAGPEVRVRVLIASTHHRSRREPVAPRGRLDVAARLAGAPALDERVEGIGMGGTTTRVGRREAGVAREPGIPERLGETTELGVDSRDERDVTVRARVDAGRREQGSRFPDFARSRPVSPA